ncbi:MAG: hypothetical protein NTZ60_04410 [Campylobacterales bacterium]|nr:hypothetical protein [Campylobacterales bacterium]
MTAPIYLYATLPTKQLESFLTSIFKPIKDAFQSGAKEFANTMLIEMIFALKTQNNEISKLRDSIYRDKNLATLYDTEEFHDIMSDVENTLEKLVEETKEYKDKSDIFNEFYIIADELYTNVMQLSYQVSQCASEVEYAS